MDDVRDGHCRNFYAVGIIALYVCICVCVKLHEISEILDPFFKIIEYLNPEAISGCTSYLISILG